MPKTTYNVLSPLRHNGVKYGPGPDREATISSEELDQAQAESLLAKGTIAPRDTAATAVEDEPATDKASAPTKTPRSRK